MERRRLVSRVHFKGEQYVSFADLIESIREVADDYCDAEYHEACTALRWLAEQLDFSMIVDGIRYEQEQD